MDTLFKKVVPVSTTTSNVQISVSLLFVPALNVIRDFVLEFLSNCIHSFNSPGLYGQVSASQKSLGEKKKTFYK